MRLATALLACLLAQGVTSHAADPSARATLDDVLAEDASLRDVEFVDNRHGWAVGDRGVVLVTTNGGARWRRVPTPTDNRLDGVSFLDAQRGWAVGGMTRPYTHESRGVVLATVDGGRQWEVVSTGPLPRLRSIKFFDAKNGVAAGDGTALHPSGLFTTRDGGRHWQPIGGGEPRQWQAADFLLDPLGQLVGSAAGLRGATARLTKRRVESSLGAGDLRGGYGVALVDPARGWLVGDGGMIRTTNDGGAAWAPPIGQPPQELADWFDYRAVAAEGNRVWVAGSPGSLVLSSTDGGETWHTTPTGISTPITAITFVNDADGWAVGELGTILATHDGGQSWHVQRGEGRRAAAAFVVATGSDLPVEPLVTTAASEGYRSIVTAPLVDEGHREAASLASRLPAAAGLAGADATRLGWSIPMAPSEAGLPGNVLRQRLDRLTDARTSELLTHDLHKLLVTYRPEVLVVPAVDGDSSGAAELLTTAANEAVRRASGTAPPVITGLRAWKPKSVVAFLIDDGSPLRPNDARLSSGDFSAALGATPSQWHHEARGLLTTAYQTAPAAYRLTRLDGQPMNGTARGGLLGSTTVRRDSAIRRPAAMPSSNRLEQLRRLAGRRRNMERLLDQASGDPAWAGQVVNLTGGLDEAAGADLLSQLAAGYRRAGRYELAAETLYLLARRYPDSPTADAAMLWLIRYYASGERAHADSRVKGIDKRPKTLANLSGRAVGELPPVDKRGVLTGEERLDRTAALIEFLEQARPGLFAEPAVRFLQSATQRGRGLGTAADKTTLLLSKRSIAADWSRAAKAERWLAKPEGLPPEKPIANSRFTSRRPKLDGMLEDPTWSGAEAIRLAERPDTEPTATVRFAHDDTFLFIAVEAVATNPASIDQSSKRPRDADLTRSDRLVLRIDTDRDYTTAFELAIDSRGYTHDAVWNDPHWQPTWYVAAGADDRHWHAEAAIPLSQLADPKHVPRAAWAVSLRRLTPGEASSAWPAGIAPSESPDAYGLLLFD